MQAKIESFLDSVKDAVATEKLLLPSIPEVALSIRDECEKVNSSAQQVAEILSQDPALSVRLLQVANSSLYRTRSSIENIQMAITRLGLRLVKDLIMGLAMKQLYKASNDVLAERFKELWMASSKTAALSRMLAVNCEGIDPEKAMLAGLTHNIGALPILIMAEDDDDLFDNPEALHKIIKEMQGEVGAYIFKAWHFPEYMIDVSKECYDFTRTHNGPADYVDVTQVALLEGSIYTCLDCPDPEYWDTVPAFEKLGIDTVTNILEIEDNKLVFEETHALFK
jgi:HD-like signal output (HDOD) protein